MMRAITEGLMRCFFAENVESVRLVVKALVVVGTGLNGHDGIAFRNVVTAYFCISHDKA